MQSLKKPDLSQLREELPPFISRKYPKFKDVIGYSPRTFANMDCLGLTKSIKKIVLGGAVAYERESLIAWLEDHSKIIEK
jgi:hypothetical protein